MTLTLHHADDLEPLLDGVAEMLAGGDRVSLDPFVPDVVVVPTAGVRDAVTAHLGRRLGVSHLGGDGVAANVDLVYMGRFVARALGLHTFGDEVEPDPWHISRLTWSVLDVLSSTSVPLPVEHIDWSFARRVADLFDRYATQRPQLIDEWWNERAVDAAYGLDRLTSTLRDDHLWQYHLWREVRTRVDQPSLPERLPHLLESIGTGAVEPDLPARLALVGFVSIAPAQWQLLRALGQVRDIHVFLRTSSRAAWHGGSVDLAGCPTALRGGSGDTVDPAAGRVNPLLVSWGRRALDTRAFLGGTPDAQVVDADSPLPAARSLLQAVQNDIRLDREPTTWPGHHDRDRSIQVHACHGETRQLEVLRDALGHVFVDHPDLHPSDVIVMCPQLDRFAPLIEAVFARGDMPIPVRVGDRSLTTDDPTGVTLTSLLDVVSGRVSLPEIMSLVQSPPIRRRFGWSPSDVETITRWALELGGRWGFSAEHRRSWDLDRDEENGTWLLVVRRLLAGLAHAAPEPYLGLGGVPPHVGIASDSADVVGSLAEFLSRLLHLHHTVTHGRDVEEWVHVLHTTLDEFCAADPDDPWSFAQVHGVLDDILESATVVDGDGRWIPSPHVLTRDEIRQVLDDALTARAGRLDFRTGKVTVTSLQPLHGVPARVVCLLGLDDGSLPTGSFDGDDVLGVTPCVGERNPRHDSRQMLLDCLLAARDAFVITCNGANIATNAPEPFIVPIAELLDVVAVTTGRQPGDRLPMVARHPRHGFDDRALSRQVEPHIMPALDRPITFDSSMLRAATGRSREVVTPDASDRLTRWRLGDHADGVLDVGTLLSTVADPASQTVGHRLGVVRVAGAGSLSDVLDLSIDSLTRSILRRDLLAHAAALDARSSHPISDSEWHQALHDWSVVARFTPGVPFGLMGESELTSIMNDVSLVRRAAIDRGVPVRGAHSVTVELGDVVVPYLDGSPVEVRIVGSIDGVHLEADRAVVVDVVADVVRPKQRLVGALELALLTLAEPTRPWSAWVIGRNTGVGVSTYRLSLVDDPVTSARALVSMAVQLVWWARSDAVPYFGLDPKTLGAAGTPGKIESAISHREAAILWRDWDPVDLLEQPVLDTDPVMLAAAPTASRVRATAAWIWGVYSSSITESTT